MLLCYYRLLTLLLHYPCCCRNSLSYLYLKFIRFLDCYYFAKGYYYLGLLLSPPLFALIPCISGFLTSITFVVLAPVAVANTATLITFAVSETAPACSVIARVSPALNTPPNVSVTSLLSAPVPTTALLIVCVTPFFVTHKLIAIYILYRFTKRYYYCCICSIICTHPCYCWCTPITYCRSACCGCYVLKILLLITSCITVFYCSCF